LSIFKSAFEKLSIDNQQEIALATRTTAESVSPGGALFSKVDELIRAIKATSKKQSEPSAGAGTAGSAIMMRLIGGKALTEIGRGLSLIIDAINKLKGEGKDLKEKMIGLAVGIDAIARIGPSILKFAGYLFLAAPLLAIGVITAPLFGLSLFIIVKTLEWATKPLTNDKTMAALQALDRVALGIIALGLVMVLAAPLYAFGITSLPLIALSLLVIGGTFYLLDKLGIDSSMKKTSEALGFAALAILALGVSFVLTSMLLNTVKDPWIMMAQIGALVLGTGIAFALIGEFATEVLKGAIVMTLATIPIILLGLAALLFSKSVSPDESGWITLAQIAAAVAGIGAGMAIAGAAAPFILAGAAAMLVAGVALVAIGFGISSLAAAFKSGGVDALLADSGHKTEGIFGFGGGRMMSKMEYLMYSLGNSFMISPIALAAIYAGAPAMIMAGFALKSIAWGIQSFQSMKINYDILPAQIAKVTTVLADAFGAVGKKFPGGRNFLSFVGRGSQSAVADGIDAVLGMGNALTSIAVGMQGMASLKFPVYEGTKIVRYETLDNSVWGKVASNTGIMVNVLANEFGKIGAQYPRGSHFLSSLIGHSPVADGVDAVLGMGNALGSIARGMQDMANLKFPIYEGTKIVGYHQLDAGVWDTVTSNVQNIVHGLSGVFGDIGKSPEADRGWWFGKSKIQHGIELVSEFANPIAALAKIAQEIADNKIDPEAVKAKVIGLVGAFNAAYTPDAKGNALVNADMVSMTGTLADKIKQIVDYANGYATFVGQYGKYVDHFVRFKDAVNDFDQTNLKFTADLFNGLTYLAKSGNAIDKMGEQLTSAIQELAKMIEDTKNNLATSGQQQTGIMQEVGSAISGFSSSVSGFFTGSSAPSTPTNAAIAKNTAAVGNLPTPASPNNSQDITALVVAMNQLIAKFNDQTGMNAPIVRVRNV